jgi:hypothetical protein
MFDLKGKSVLFFCPKFFGYELEIANKLSSLGASVDAYDERPRNNFVTKASIRINKALLKRTIEEYYNIILDKTATKVYDYVFIVNIEAMLPAILERLRAQQNKAVFILYMWDSLQNKKRTEATLSYFDRVFSFDKTDAEKLNDVMFRPLFYIDQYARIAKANNKATVDLCFIGTVHSDRYHLLKNLKEQVHQFGFKADFFQFFPSAALFVYKKVTDIKFYKARFREFHFHPLRQLELEKRISAANVILDIQHPSQTGLTIRTIEMIGAQKKLITTNADIVNYDFFDEQNILVIDRQNPILNPDFFKTSYRGLEESILYKYGIEGWLRDLFT